MKELQINIFDIDLVWKGVIDSVESLIHRTSWHNISNSEMRISKKAKYVNELQIGRILVVNNRKDKALIIEEMEASLDDNYWIFTLIPLKGILNYRICHPTDINTFTDLRQSEVMMKLVSENLVIQTRDYARKFWNSFEDKNMLTVAPYRQFNDIISFKVDWKTGLMGDAIIDIANMYGENFSYPVGWNIYINGDYENLEMNTYAARIRTINQTENPPIVFSEDFGNIKNATYFYSIKDWRNIAYVIWEDLEGNPKETHNFDTSKGSTVGFNRKEMIVNSSKNLSSETHNEGQAELNKRPHIESFTAEIVNNDKTMSTFEVDWFLGDVVTIQSKKIFQNKLISIDTQVTEIEEIYDNGEYSVNATFGEGKLSILKLIKNAINEK